MDERALFKFPEEFSKRFIDQYEGARKHKTKVKLKWYIRMKAGSMATIVVSAAMITILVPQTLSGKLSIGMFMALTNAVFGIVQNMSWDLTSSIDTNTWYNEYFKEMCDIWKMEEDSIEQMKQKDVGCFDSLTFG